MSKTLTDKLSHNELLLLVSKLEEANQEHLKTLENHKIMTDTINETFFLSDYQEKKVLYVSPSYERMFGMPTETLYKDPTSWETNLHPEDKERVRHAFNSKIPLNTYDEEYRIIRSDGKIDWVRDRAYPIKDKDGNLKLIAGITQFITQKKESDFRLKETTENLVQMLETIPVGILIVDKEYNTIFANKFILNILALPQEEIYTTNILSKMSETFYDELQESLGQIVHKHHTKSEEVNFINFINEEYWVDLKATKIHFNGQESILVTMNDITNLKSAQESIVNSRKNLYALLNNTEYASILLSRDARIIKFNNAALDLFSFLTEMYLMEKIPIINYFSEPEYQRFKAEFNKALNNEKVFFEKEYFLMDGESFWIEERYHPAKSEEGEIFGVTYSLVNITERKNAEREIIKSKAYLKAIFESSSELNLFALDKDLKYTAFNGQHAFKMHQLWNKDIEIGTSITDVITDQYSKDILLKNFKRALKGEEFTLVESFTNSEDKIYYENSYSPIIHNKNEIEGIVVIIRDITEKIINRQKLEESEKELKELNVNKDKFLSIIAHDLKAPLSGFISLSYELSDNLDSMTKEDVKILSKSMNESATNIFQLLENLLEWTSTITGKKQVSFDNLNPHLIVETLISLFKDISKSKNVKIINKIDKNLYLYGDANMFTTILRNLISNSIKFTQDGEITVACKIIDNMAQVSVTDTGVGMKPETKVKLFRIDQNVSTLGTNEEKGTGLGLILCKEFVEKNNGKIWVESELGKGSTFYFTFPLAD